MNEFILTNQYPSLRNKRIVITGGATGIGSDLVRAFASQQARVQFLDIDFENAELLCEELKSSGADVSFLRCDVSSLTQLQDSLKACADSLGGVDVLINNAANDKRHEWDKVTINDWENGLRLNLGSQFFAMQAIVPSMSQGACIINMGSVSWMRRRGGMVAYTSSKAAIHGLTRTMAQELGPMGIRVNSLVPGAIKTPKQDRLVVTPELEKHFLDTQALKFRLIGRDVAAMALFLASDDARGCAGQAFIVDAGIS